MIRPATCVCMLLAAGSGLYLYQIKHRSQLLDREIVQTIKQTDAMRDRIGVLRGEWALLNEPERLAELTRQHLGLKTLSPSQFAALADLGSRLPPPGSVVPPNDEPDGESVAGEPAPAAKPAPAPKVASVATKPPPAPAAARVASRPAPTPVTPPAADPAPTPRPAAPVVTASAGPPSPPHPAHSIIGGGVERRPIPVPEPKAAVMQASAYAPPPPVVASALGGNYRALPPPVPFSANPAAIPGGR